MWTPRFPTHPPPLPTICSASVASGRHEVAATFDKLVVVWGEGTDEVELLAGCSGLHLGADGRVVVAENNSVGAVLLALACASSGTAATCDVVAGSILT